MWTAVIRMTLGLMPVPERWINCLPPAISRMSHIFIPDVIAGSSWRGTWTIRSKSFPTLLRKQIANSNWQLAFGYMQFERQRTQREELSVTNPYSACHLPRSDQIHSERQ